MRKPKEENRPLFSILCAFGACFFFSLNDVTMKMFSGKYPLYELTFFRSIVALTICLAIIIPLEGGYSNLRTNRPLLHFIRGSSVVVANVAFFSGIAVLPLAEATAIFFVSPLLITFLAAVFLGEKVGWFRWSALVVGLAGVMLIVKPFGIAFRWETIFPLTAALSYSLLQTLTRKIGPTEKASTMAFYIQVSFMTYMGILVFILHNGRFDIIDHPAFQFLTKAWVWPTGLDWMFIVFIGITNAFGGYLISQAYRLSVAGLVSPFEYSSLVLSVFWGIVIWGEYLNILTALGIVIILVSGIIIAIREYIRNINPSIKKALDRR